MKTVYKLTLTHDIRETHKLVSCICWSPEGNWLASCSNNIARIWEVQGPNKKAGQRQYKLTNGMICTLKKHQGTICKIQFHTENLIVTSGLDKSIILWELCSSINKDNEIYLKSRVVRRISNTKFYQEILITPNRFICRKGNPANEIKILKFKNLKTDLTEEALSDEYYKETLA